MATATRIYIVRSKSQDGVARLVRATHPAHALKHVADSEYTVGVPTQDELIALAREDTAVEELRHEQQELPA
jgi:hypothetical protein